MCLQNVQDNTVVLKQTVYVLYGNYTIHVKQYVQQTEFSACRLFALCQFYENCNDFSPKSFHYYEIDIIRRPGGFRVKSSDFSPLHLHVDFACTKVNFVNVKNTKISCGLEHTMNCR